MNRLLDIPRPHKAPQVPRDYLDLVQKFPLRPIRSKTELAAAGQMLDRLVGRADLTRGQRDYLVALTHFVGEYEREHASMMMQTLSPADALKHLMEENEMSVTDLGRIVGSRGLASEILSGSRGMSKRIIVRLSERFRVSPALFLRAS